MDMNLFKPNLTIHDDDRGMRMRNNPKYETLDGSLPSIHGNRNTHKITGTPAGALLMDIRMTARGEEGLSSNKSRTA
jgi:hypothetical protein